MFDKSKIIHRKRQSSQLVYPHVEDIGCKIALPSIISSKASLRKTSLQENFQLRTQLMKYKNIQLFDKKLYNQPETSSNTDKSKVERAIIKNYDYLILKLKPSQVLISDLKYTPQQVSQDQDKITVNLAQKTLSQIIHGKQKLTIIKQLISPKSKHLPSVRGWENQGSHRSQ